MTAATTNVQTGICDWCGKSWQAAAWVRRKRYCDGDCLRAATKERSGRQRAESRAARLAAGEQAALAALRWQPGPWHMPRSWQDGHVSARSERRMPAAGKIAEFWHGREPFPVDQAAPACFACGREVDGWERL